LALLRIAITGLPPARDLGARIQAARLKRGWSRQELAERSGLSLPTLRGIESNVGRVTSVEAAIQALAPTARERRHYRPKPRTAMAGKNDVGHAVAKLLRGNCLEIMPSLEPGSADLVITSPPYNAGKQYENELSVTEYERVADEWVSYIPRLLTDRGALGVNLGYTKVSALPRPSP
jgi:DNA-binding XRE family transcriptional regulator